MRGFLLIAIYRFAGSHINRYIHRFYTALALFLICRLFIAHFVVKQNTKKKNFISLAIHWIFSFFSFDLSLFVKIFVVAIFFCSHGKNFPLRCLVAKFGLDHRVCVSVYAFVRIKKHPKPKEHCVDKSCAPIFCQMKMWKKRTKYTHRPSSQPKWCTTNRLYLLQKEGSQCAHDSFKHTHTHTHTIEWSCIVLLILMDLRAIYLSVPCHCRCCCCIQFSCAHRNVCAQCKTLSAIGMPQQQ